MATSYQDKKARLLAGWSSDGQPLRLRKSTISNLFRYQPRGRQGRRLDLGSFNGVLALDAGADGAQPSLEAEGLATYETIVRHTLPRGFLPLVAPELKHITVGGATVGIGIESTCFRYGFVHDGLIEADVLLPGGSVVTCSADNEHADLFHALPNSYGTLGYILRAKIALHPAAPYTHLRVRRFEDLAAYLEAMQTATCSGEEDFVEGLVFEDRRFYLMTGRMIAQVPRVDDIVRRHVFYKLVEQQEDVYLSTFDYIFRYDPEWFWNIPESWPYALFRRYAPLALRNSSFYTRYVAFKTRLERALPGAREPDTEPLIQDWQVPWARAAELIELALREVRLDGRPWAAVPIEAPRQPTLYPIEPRELYFNLGCYCQVRKPRDKPDYYYTRIMDEQCFALGGIKMLYSSTFLDEKEFARRYNGDAYSELKRRYDPQGNAPTLYAKVAAPSSTAG